MSLSKSSRHDCHYVLKTDTEFFTCDGCKMSGFGQRFNCKLCGRELHRECKNPKTRINHEYFGCSTLTFLQKPFMKFCECCKQDEYSKHCDACGKAIRGFSYHCGAGSGEGSFDLHPCCANLDKKLTIDNTVFNLVSKVSSKWKRCHHCHERKISNGDSNVSGWSYVSTCGTYNFHVYCMADMLHDALLIKTGNSALEKVDLQQLTKTKKNGGSKSKAFPRILKSLLRLIASVLLGDPTIFISNTVLDLVTGGEVMNE